MPAAFTFLMVTLALLAPISGTSRSHRAIPTVIVFASREGGARVVLANVDENRRFMSALERLRGDADTVGRPAFDVAMFYPSSNAATAGPPDRIPLSLADLRAVYFPADGRRSALLLPSVSLSSGAVASSTVSEAGLRVLALHGIRTHTSAR